MNWLDWTVMLGTILGIVAYGVWKTRRVSTVESYLLGDRDLKWWTIGLSIMATQASAITFLSTPGQAFENGMGFAQFYFGLPIAMVFLCIFFIPLFYRLKVYTAYEFLEGRFGLPTRTLTSILFLIQRGLAAGLTIYAPSIILSTIMDWSLNSTILFTGMVVTYYTVSGGTKAVSVTQTQQMIVMMVGLVVAAIIVTVKLSDKVAFDDAISLAGQLDKLKVVDFEFNLTNRYNFWSGMIGGVFLFLSYFGTDQSQVQRYLSGKSLTESRLGLLFNGIFKVPMQFLILFVGILVFLFYQFNPRPLHFIQDNVEKISDPALLSQYKALETDYFSLQLQQREAAAKIIAAKKEGNASVLSNAKQLALDLAAQDKELKSKAEQIILQNNPNAKTKDTDYVFITFVTQEIPKGLVGFLLAVIFCAAMSSTASELSALATCSIIDIYQRSFVKNASDRHYLLASKWGTVLWGGIALIFALTADLFENLIQAVNIIGSLFYGVILGIFFVAFFLKKVGGKIVFPVAILSEGIILLIFWLKSIGYQLQIGNYTIKVDIAYLWLNLVGCSLVVILCLLVYWLTPRRS